MITLKHFPILATSRLELIEIEAHHQDQMFALYSDENVTQYFDLLPLKTKEEAQREIDFYRKRYADGIGIRWGIAFKESSEIIGTIGYNKIIPNHKGRIGYDLQTQYWGQGIMSEALNAIIAFGFETQNIVRIEAEVMQGNTGSEKLLEKCQFKKEGVLQQWMYWNEKYYDISMFALLKSDYIK